MENQTQSLTRDTVVEIIRSELDKEGWETLDASRHTAVARLLFDSFVGIKEAFVYVSHGDGYNYSISGDYSSEGNNVLAAGVLVPVDADEETIREITRQFAARALDRIYGTYAMRLLVGPIQGEVGKHDWCLGDWLRDGCTVFVDDRQLKACASPDLARAYALDVIADLQADGDYRLNDKPQGFLPPKRYPVELPAVVAKRWRGGKADDRGLTAAAARAQLTKRIREEPEFLWAVEPHPHRDTRVECRNRLELVAYTQESAGNEPCAVAEVVSE